MDWGVSRQAPAHPASQVETFPLFYGYGESGKTSRVSKDRQRAVRSQGNFCSDQCLLCPGLCGSSDVLGDLCWFFLTDHFPLRVAGIKNL